MFYVKSSIPEACGLMTVTQPYDIHRVFTLYDSYLYDRLASQSDMGHLTYKLNYRRYPSNLPCTLLLFLFNLLPSPVHSTGFSLGFFRGFLAIFTLLSSNKKATYNLAPCAMIVKYWESCA